MYLALYILTSPFTYLCRPLSLGSAWRLGLGPGQAARRCSPRELLQDTPGNGKEGVPFVSHSLHGSWNCRQCAAILLN